MRNRHSRVSHRASNAREAAFEALQAWRRHGAWSDITFRSALSALPPRERALASQLGYGVTARTMTLDGYIRLASSIGLSRVEPAVLDILRLGVYQMLFLSRIPKPAAVDETVKLARKYASARAVPYVNAVLRTVSGWESPPALPELWMQTSHPQWFVERLIGQEGFERTKALLEFNNTVPPLCINMRPNSKLAEQFIALGAAPHPLLSDCLLMERPGDVEELPGFHDGGFLISDPASRMAVMAANPRPGESMLDACAAPGGKTVLSHWHCGGDLSITACDLYGHRVVDLQETLAKYAVNGVQCIERSAARFFPDYAGAFDLVLADAPCSGFGVIRKKPDIRYKSMEDADAMPAIQSAILDNLSSYVKPGGRLVYVTCTVLDSENGGVVRRFLERHPEFLPEPFVLPIGDAPDGEFSIWPPEHNMDGFYMARLRKNHAAS